MITQPRFFNRPRLWGLLCGLTLAVAQLFTPAGMGTAQAATTTCTPNGATQNCTVTFSASGAPESWTVPSSVTSATFDLYGAQGGGGGLGGRVTATLAVTPGASYQVRVGVWGNATDIPARGDYDELLGSEGNDTLLDGDGVRNVSGGAGNDLLTIGLRKGWRDGNGQANFAGLTAGYGNDVVGLAILDPARFFVDISGDERDNPASPLEGNNDSLGLAGVIDPTSPLIKFEKRLVISADSEIQIPSEEAGAEYLTEPVGEESGEDVTLTNRIFLPLVNR